VGIIDRVQTPSVRAARNLRENEETDVHTQIYVNLPVEDVERSRRFFGALGYGFDEGFSNDDALCVRLGENLYAMMLKRAFFQTFTDKRIADARTETEALVCVSCTDRAAVDALVAKAVALGGRAPRLPADHGFMYIHSYEDPDGHVWELVAYAQPAGGSA
jgi:predicted lactoylglutathione lyase